MAQFTTWPASKPAANFEADWPNLTCYTVFDRLESRSAVVNRSVTCTSFSANVLYTLSTVNMMATNIIVIIGIASCLLKRRMYLATNIIVIIGLPVVFSRRECIVCIVPNVYIYIIYNNKIYIMYTVKAGSQYTLDCASRCVEWCDDALNNLERMRTASVLIHNILYASACTRDHTPPT